MSVKVAAALFCLLGHIATAQLVYSSAQRSNQLPSTTVMPPLSTPLSMAPQTSVSVYHSIVRNKPAYPYPHTESSLQADASEDTSYYYTYEDSVEETTKKMSSTTPSTTTSPSSKSTVRSFWNSQKALLDARRKESAQKLVPTYGRTTVKTEKPKIEFKVREKPKFGLSSKNRDSTTTTETPEQKPQTTTTKSVKYNTNDANLADTKIAEKEIPEKSSKNNDNGGLPNQIIGRVGEIPLPTSLLSSHLQQPLSQQNKFGNSRQSKFDESVQYVDHSPPQIQPLHLNNYKPNLVSNRNPQSLLDFGNKQELLIDLSKQQQPKLSQPVSNFKQQPNMDPAEFLKQLLTQQLVSNGNQQSHLRSTPLLQNQNPLPLPNTNLQSISGHSNSPTGTSFLAASQPASNAGIRHVETFANSPASTLLSRLGNVGLNLGGEPSAAQSFILGREGGAGHGSGLTFNLGPVPDPLSVLLKLLSLIPRPLLDLNGKIFFGIELGKNAGLVSGAAKPIG